MQGPEQLKSTERSTVETQEAAGEQLEKLKNRVETGGERPEAKLERLEAARRDTREILSKEPSKEHKADTEPLSAATTVRVTKRVSYTRTMTEIRSHMSAPARAFSGFIHAPFVEKSSEVIGSTFARPNAILAGSFTALLLVTTVQGVARVYGYQLSGFETIGSFLLGWALGIIYDYVKVMVTGKST